MTNRELALMQIRSLTNAMEKEQVRLDQAIASSKNENNTLEIRKYNLQQAKRIEREQERRQAWLDHYTEILKELDRELLEKFMKSRMETDPLCDRVWKERENN